MLKFSVTGIPVQVHFSFLILALIGGARRPAEYVAWMAVVFLAVLLHELGHAVTARRYGAVPVTITLFAFGGVTTYPARADLTPGRRFVIAAAGSFVGIVTGGLTLLAVRAGWLVPSDPLLRYAIQGFVWAALGWGVLNWIPIRPLDGGAMLTSFLEIVAPKRALTIARFVSVVTGIAAAVLLYRIGATFGAFFVLLITLAGFRDGTPSRARPEPPPTQTQQPATKEEPPPQFPI